MLATHIMGQVVFFFSTCSVWWQDPLFWIAVAISLWVWGLGAAGGSYVTMQSVKPVLFWLILWSFAVDFQLQAPAGQVASNNHINSSNMLIFIRQVAGKCIRYVLWEGISKLMELSSSSVINPWSQFNIHNTLYISFVWEAWKSCDSPNQIQLSCQR